MQYIHLIAKIFRTMKKIHILKSSSGHSSCRCIAVTTTLEEVALQQGSPSLIRKNIGDISINDILYGGSNARHSM